MTTTEPVKKLTNEQFAALPAAEKRVIIAKDVLSWLDTKKLLPRAGTYLRITAPAVAPVEDFLGDQALSLKDRDVVNGNSCHACALGGVFATMAERGCVSIKDAARAGSAINFEMHRMLAAVFSNEQLTAIECAFERSTTFAYDYEVEDVNLASRASEFGAQVARKHPKYSRWDTTFEDEREVDEAVMRAIMQNIIDNQGTFVP